MSLCDLFAPVYMSIFGLNPIPLTPIHHYYHIAFTYICHKPINHIYMLEETQALDSFLCYYPACKKVGLKYGMTTHEARILTVIHTMCLKFPNVTRWKVASHTYIWYSVLHHNVGRLVSLGYIEPLRKPRNFLHLTPLGLSVVSDIFKEYRRFSRKLEEGKEKKRVKR